MSDEIIKQSGNVRAHNAALRSYKWAVDNRKKLFQKMSTTDYVTMWFLANIMEEPSENQRIYLQEMADKLKLPIPKVSKIVRELQERNLVKWKHDGAGEDGTYIQITEKGIKAANEQQEILKEFYHNVIKRFGEEDFLDLIGKIGELEEIMNDEIEKMGG